MTTWRPSCDVGVVATGRVRRRGHRILRRADDQGGIDTLVAEGTALVVSGRHALPDTAYEHYLGHAERGVSEDAYYWWALLMADRLLGTDRHPRRRAACDCRSCTQHLMLNQLAPGDLRKCPGPLATILVEKQKAEAMMARSFAARFPMIDVGYFNDWIATDNRFAPGGQLP